MSLEVRFCTIISNDGITIFHRTFLEDELDEYLFSGFSSAMIAFSRELGDELTQIQMEQQTIFYREAQEDGVLILSLTKGYELQDVMNRIDDLVSRNSINLLLAGSRLGIVQNENENFERDLFELFDINPKVIGERSNMIDLNQEDENYVPPDTNLDIPKMATDDLEANQHQADELDTKNKTWIVDEDESTVHHVDEAEENQDEDEEDEDLKMFMDALNGLESID